MKEEHNELPVYIPKAHICHMTQYQCCKNHSSCRLYSICAQIKKQTVCQRDCPNCSYSGCTLSLEYRQSNPIYTNGVIQENRIDLDVQGRYLREQAEHRSRHVKRYRYYNSLFGDYREKRNKRQRERYHADLEYSRQRAREWYRTHYIKQVKPIPEAIMPECQMNCENCKYEDCILPEDWRKKANQANWRKNNPDYFAKYRKENRQLLRKKNKDYYTQHKDERLAYQKEHRSKPEIKAQRAVYDKTYRKTHPEIEKEKKRRYRQRHPEKIREQKRAYWEAHKDEINAKRRANRATKKVQKQSESFVV